MPEDISDLSNTEPSMAYMAEIVRSSDDAILSKDLNGIITSWNKGAERLFGYTADEVVGNSVKILIPAGHENEEPEILARLRRGEKIQHYETVRRRKDGSLLDISLTVSPVRDALGNIIGAAKIARDITQQKRAEKELREYAARLAEADQEKDNFLAVLAHELRNPLAPIRSGLEIIRGKKVSVEELEDILSILERQTNHLVRLVDDLLDVERVTHGKIKLNKENIDVRTAIEAALEAVESRVKTAGLKLTVTLPPEPIFINGDATKIIQIFINLLNNASRYTDTGGSVWIRVENDNDEAVVRVLDTGIGIEPAELQRIFELFGQIEKSVEHRPNKGLGIGLFLVKRLVELHGGTITAYSDGKDKGSEFVVRLPMVASSHATVDRKEKPKDDSVASRRILVVDDNVDAAQMLKVLLSSDGHDVTVAYEPKAAIQTAEEFGPQVVLLDLGLPEMDGYEVCQRLRINFPDILLIAVTGWSTPEDRQRSLEVGFDYHLVKPVELDELNEVIKIGRDKKFDAFTGASITG